MDNMKMDEDDTNSTVAPWVRRYPNPVRRACGWRLKRILGLAVGAAGIYLAWWSGSDVGLLAGAFVAGAGGWLFGSSFK